MQSVSDNDIQTKKQDLLKKTRFELAAKGVFRLGQQGVPGLWTSKRESTATDS